ncbi:MAG: hypothetical protein A2932_00790 [Candidatus Spechtbacteria bacterium RIFCSPLOWO2_01_FULL_46_10]|uniref:Uncharacterized protein n=1 Tax=Candidatus Spechtbacteria bacterium RIFCSPLOWO2_01_FULL_46_10 TaxID=1802163 RepID=A0A1G2HEH0_9BACT|nr:MAG: hypothetical protein A2932_00790 [Candidatus Spechtbacteria bacterium RIFCSPLOWO2_01_FULL_46_10]
MRVRDLLFYKGLDKKQLPFRLHSKQVQVRYFTYIKDILLNNTLLAEVPCTELAEVLTKIAN